MFLKGDIVFLRATEPSDAELLYSWENDPEIWRVSGTTMPFSKALMQDFVNARHNDIYTNRQLRLMAGSLSSQETVGIVDLFDFDPVNERCGVGVLIQKANRNTGIGSECLRLLRKYAFETLMLNQLYAEVAESNTSSLSLFEKCGFEKTSLKRDWQKTGPGNYENVWLLQAFNRQ